jgi:hypothetical protein
MQMTQALRDLLKAHHQDTDFPYLDFLGAFILVERWVRHHGFQASQLLNEANGSDLLGMPIGFSEEDLKLGRVMDLLKSHGLEVLRSVSQDREADQPAVLH